MSVYRGSDIVTIFPVYVLYLCCCITVCDAIHSWFANNSTNWLIPVADFKHVNAIATRNRLYKPLTHWLLVTITNLCMGLRHRDDSNMLLNFTL